MIISLYYDEPQGTSTIFVLKFGTTMTFLIEYAFFNFGFWFVSKGYVIIAELIDLWCGLFSCRLEAAGETDGER